MKLKLDFSGLTEIAQKMMPEGIDFTLSSLMIDSENIDVNFDMSREIEQSSRDDHKNLIGHYLSDLAIIGYLLTFNERKILNKYGAWMEALISEEIPPLTSAQRRFINVHKGLEEVESEFERIWIKVIQVRSALKV
ncbi:DUF413 domain-containing protein [Raoultella ornithinolytica]|uniref:DUF413 domain-containing protein n=1 Tax=Klebsiella/Raoultella group TaxID=2890311 RepID=UPI00104BECD6|nr:MULTISPECIES: DUF413 domain-containing protein [Klebsiella/Raoultella group]ELT9707218.1 DUF413 domain-containing protein [Klebsiella michiganensis]MDV0602507.1 DUF413 domain-containing protein [Raoultella ornithinolytica]TCZ55857.1 hypothetical protein E0D83_25695 [Klebsiella grimontii]